MPDILLYLLKANVALLLFYLAYHVVLRRLTFYHLNRLFLVFGLVFSAVYPLLDLSALFSREEQLATMYRVTIPAWVYAVPTAAPLPDTFDYWQLPVYLFWLGVAVMLVRLILQFASLYRIHVASSPASYKGVPYREVQSEIQAFSFWRTIYLNPSQHQPAELESILWHELVHITGWHTLDVLLGELMVVFYWFNPGAWLMRKALKENLEFIADHNVISAGSIDRKQYQYLLLKVVGAAQPQVINQFNYPSLKRRITMMNKVPTRKANQFRLLIVLPLVTILLFAFQSNVKPETEAPVAQALQGDDIMYYIDGVKATKQEAEQLPPDAIHSVDVVKGEQAKKVPGNRAGKNVVSLTTKQNKDSAQVLKFKESLPQPKGQGQTGMLPPPPPPKKYDGPAIPKAGGPRLVENEEYVVYTLWPEEITKRELEVAQQVFRESGFSFEFEENYENGKINGVRLNLNSKAGQSSAEASYNPKDIQNLLAADNIVLVQANKKIGKVGISHTLAQR
ncbi:M56 family metallopeptidase [Pontibacter sp. CAU 1760]